MTLRFALLSSLCVVLSACGSSSELVSDGAVDAPPVDASDAADSGAVDSEVPPDAGREACVAPGASRAASCGNCGTRSERCVDGFWTPTGECLAQGECSPGATESRVEGECVPSQRVCTASCEWLPWETVGEPAPDAECSVGQLRWEISDSCRPNHYIPTRCNETTCRWERGACEDACAGVARQSPWEAEEICIPGGELLRGGERWPMGIVTLSPYYLDRYPVTIARYQACVSAGGCTEVRDLMGAVFDDDSHAQRPAYHVSPEQIEAFCEWDGGRRLPTEAEWELAAKGPAPRHIAYMWGDSDETPVCAWRSCGLEYWGDEPRYDVDELPNVRSIFGVDLMVLGVFEWTQDAFDPDFYSRSMGALDPVNREGSGRVSRGYATTAQFGGPIIYERFAGYQPPGEVAHGGRCARTP